MYSQEAGSANASFNNTFLRKVDKIASGGVPGVLLKEALASSVTQTVRTTAKIYPLKLNQEEDGQLVAWQIQRKVVC